MRAIIDTNVWISILLSPAPFTTNKLIEEAFLERRFTAVVPEDLITEIRGATSTRKWLVEHIALDSVEILISTFYQQAIVVGAFEGSSDRILRDSRDDYLIRAARAHQVDMLVSGDDDVLAHAGNEPFAILSSPAFVAALAVLTDS